MPVIRNPNVIYFRFLTLVYAAIAVSVVALPAFVYGVVLVVRALAPSEDKHTR
jgi:hypothetical protein